MRRRVQSSRLRLGRGELEVGGKRRHTRDGGILQLCEKLNEGLAERWHDICGVVLGETADQAHSDDAVVEDLVIEGYEDGADILGLREMLVESFVQRREHRFADSRV